MIVIFDCSDNGLYYKRVTIVIYDSSESGLSYKSVMIVIFDCSDSAFTINVLRSSFTAVLIAVCTIKLIQL